MKKVIAAMTVGKDVSMLFPDVVNCSQVGPFPPRGCRLLFSPDKPPSPRSVQTEDSELKKLTYLYMINYAKTQPDLAIMAVNTFVKDSQDPNPLIRALAVRTMGCIRVDKISEYLCDPLGRALQDPDPYVRKTAAICVAKLYDISPELVEDRGFIDVLQDMLGDGNPMVVANAVAALAEITDLSGREVFQLNSATLKKLLNAVNECTEWGQVFILDSLTHAEIRNADEAEAILTRVLPRLQHVNSAVVLSCVKVMNRCLDVMDQSPEARERVPGYCRKMAPPLVTLLSAEAEIQYVALRNIEVIVDRWPDVSCLLPCRWRCKGSEHPLPWPLQVLSSEVKVFFCKYNDPVYVKMEKVDLMVRLASPANIEQVLLEFKEYASEVDVDFVRKSVRAIGRCAIAIEGAAQLCVSVLLDLIRQKVSYVVQEAIVVIKDIFRRYPNQYEAVLTDLCEHLDSLDEPEARASMIWIIGEYSDRIDNAEDLLAMFLEAFPEEPPVVQLQLLTATVKLFLRKPTEGPQSMIQLVLSNATSETDNPDLRDRAYIYWRLLSTDPEVAKDVVLSEMPVITGESDRMDRALLQSMLADIGTLASVFHRPANSFVTRTRLAVQHVEEIGEALPEAEEEAAPAQGQQPGESSVLVMPGHPLSATCRSLPPSSPFPLALSPSAACRGRPAGPGHARPGAWTAPASASRRLSQPTRRTAGPRWIPCCGTGPCCTTGTGSDPSVGGAGRWAGQGARGPGGGVADAPGPRHGAAIDQRHRPGAGWLHDPAQQELPRVRPEVNGGGRGAGGTGGCGWGMGHAANDGRDAQPLGTTCDAAGCPQEQPAGRQLLCLRGPGGCR